MDMVPISQLPAAQARKIQFIFTDIDDTLTTKGKLLAESYQALWDLFRAGIQIVPITGRCAGWVDHIARMWPVKGVVGENGAFYAYLDRQSDPPKMKLDFYESREQRAENREKLDQIRREVFQAVPTAGLASDQPYRLFDLAIDFTEDVPPHSRADIQKIVEVFQRHGAQTKVSSIHVNGWFGDFDKLKMTRRVAQTHLGISGAELKEKALFIGDSPNDQPMFEFFPISTGVANIRHFAADITHMPKYVTTQPGGLGFAEMVDTLLSQRAMAADC